MYVSGEHFGGNSDECYIPVFDHGKAKDSDTDLVYIGNLFLKRYYVVYDMSPLEHDAEYIQVGIGFRNEEALIGEQHYDFVSEVYLPEDKRIDTSHSTDGSDAYNNPLYEEKLALRGKDHDHDGLIDGKTDSEGKIDPGEEAGEEGTDGDDTTDPDQQQQ